MGFWAFDPCHPTKTGRCFLHFVELMFMIDEKIGGRWHYAQSIFFNDKGIYVVPYMLYMAKKPTL